MATITIKVLVPADDTGGVLGNISDAQVAQAMSARAAGNDVVIGGGRQSWTVNQSNSTLDYMLRAGMAPTVYNLGAAQVPGGAFVPGSLSIGGLITDAMPYVKALATVAAAAYGAQMLTGSAGVSASVAAPIAAPMAEVGALTLETGVTAAMEQAAIVSAASAPGVLSAAAATAEMAGAAWGTLATGAATQAVSAAGIVDMVAKVPTQILDSGVTGGMEQQAAISAAQSPGVVEMIKGADMGTIFDGLGGTITDISKTVTSAYGAVLGAQTEMARLDLIKAQTRAAMQPTGGQDSGGGGGGGGNSAVDSKTLLIGGALLAVVLMLAMRRQ